MAHLRHVTEAAEWLDGAEGGWGKQEDRWEGRAGGGCEVGRKVCSKEKMGV